MTISSTTNTVSYTGTGSATSFSVTYVFFGTGTTAEIEVVEVVIATGAETVKSNGSDFTVSGGSGATGTVTAAVAPASTVKWVINRTTTQTQETDYVENDPFPAESHEEALDRLTAVDQEQQRVLERTAQLPDGYTGAFDPTLPSIITGSTVLAYNAAATAFEVGPTTVAISGAAAEAAAAAASATSADGSATSAAASAATAATYAGTQSVDLFNGTGSQTAFTLSVAPANGDENNTDVHISGVYQQKNTYAVSGTTLTFSTAPPAATGNVEVMHMSARAIETPADGSVTYPKFASGLVDIDLSSVSGSDDTIASAKAIKTYVDAQVDTVDTLAETLAIGNTSGGTDLAVSAGDDITFTDSSKAIFGTGGDLEIFHNGSNTYINEAGTGKLIILATDLTMADTGNAHNYLNAVSGAGVTLYYDNNSRIATTATGVTITGVATATTFEPNGDTAAGDNAAIGYTAADGLILTGQGSTSDITLKNDADATVFTVPTGTDDILFPDGAKAMFGAGSDLQIYHDGSNSYVTDAGTGDLMLRGSNDIFLSNVSGSSIYGRFAEGGAVSLYHNGSVKFVTAATGVTITGEATATGFTGTLDGVLGGGTPSSATVTTFTSNGIDDNADALAITIDSSENVGIGTTAPGSILEVMDSAASLLTVLQVHNQNSGAGTAAAIGFNTSYAGDTSVPKAGIGMERTQAQGRGPMHFYQDVVNDVNPFSASDIVMTLTNTGRLGIGTTAPIAKLHVQVSDVATGVTASGDDFVLESSGNTGMTILSGSSNTGNILFGDVGDSDIGKIVYDHFTNSLQISTAAAERVRIDASGNVGIGTAAPATTLHVVGDATITDDLKLLSDSAILSFGADSEVTLTHVHDVGLAQPAGQTIYRGAAGDFDAAFTSRNNIHGQSDFEWGHSSGGYANTLGSHVGSGVGFICFHGGRGSSSNTYQTHGQAGCGFQDNNNRILTFFSLDTADADNQSPTTRITLNGQNGNLVVSGALSKGSGSFRITHPLESKEDTHDLVHSFIEGPQADLIYRGRVTLSGGSATVNIDTSAGMTAGTFDVLCRDVQCFTSNESGWTCVRGSVSGATLTIESEAPDCTDTISWMVVGERKDHHMIDTDWTDENGKVIVEPAKVAEEIVNIGE